MVLKKTHFLLIFRPTLGSKLDPQMVQMTKKTHFQSNAIPLHVLLGIVCVYVYVYAQRAQSNAIPLHVVFEILCYVCVRLCVCTARSEPRHSFRCGVEVLLSMCMHSALKATPFLYMLCFMFFLMSVCVYVYAQCA